MPTEFNRRDAAGGKILLPTLPLGTARDRTGSSRFRFDGGCETVRGDRRWNRERTRDSCKTGEERARPRAKLARRPLSESTKPTPTFHNTIGENGRAEHRNSGVVIFTLGTKIQKAGRLYVAGPSCARGSKPISFDPVQVASNRKSEDKIS